MTIQRSPNAEHQVGRRHGKAFGPGLIVALCLLLNPADAATGSGASYCTQTASLVRHAFGLAAGGPGNSRSAPRITAQTMI